MRTYMLAIAIAAPFAIPTAAFSGSIYVGLGGARIGPSHQRHYNQYEGLYNRYESERCRGSRAACMHREELADKGMGNCRRFRELCD
jgi:hypothetical protein